jgi:hypothetical protein
MMTLGLMTLSILLACACTYLAARIRELERENDAVRAELSVYTQISQEPVTHSDRLESVLYDRDVLRGGV